MAGGTKRRRASSTKATTAAAAAAAAAAASSATSLATLPSKGAATTSTSTRSSTFSSSSTLTTTNNYVWTIHQKLLELATATSDAASIAFQSLVDVKVGTGTGTSASDAATAAGSSTSGGGAGTTASTAGYWMIIATSVIQRLIQENKDLTDTLTGPTSTTTSTTIPTPPPTTTTSSILDRSLIVASLCEIVSRIITSERSKLEKALQASASRATVARALLVPTMGAMQCLDNLVLLLPRRNTIDNDHDEDCHDHDDDDPDNDNDHDTHDHHPKRTYPSITLVTATAALDRLIHIQAQSQDLADLLMDWSGSLEKGTTPTPTTFSTQFKEICAIVSSSAIEDQVVQTLLTADGCSSQSGIVAVGDTSASGLSPASSPSKRGRTRRQSAAVASVNTSATVTVTATTTAAATTNTNAMSNTVTTTTTSSADGGSGSSSTAAVIHSDLQPLITALLGPLVDQRIDARVAVKRWSSMALVWYNQAPLILLKLVHRLAVEPEEDFFFPLTRSLISDKSRIMYRLMAIVAESGVASGFRPPTGAMDQYLTQLAKSRDSCRVDIRDWTVVAIYDMIQIHRLCLTAAAAAAAVNESGNGSSRRHGGMVVNDDERNHSVFTAPDLSVILACLCRSASLSVTSAGYSQQSEWTRALNSIAASFCLQLTSDTTLPLDCSLSSWAISHLMNMLRLLQEQSPTDGTTSTTTTGGALVEQEDGMEQFHQLSLHVPKPKIPSVANSPSKAGDATTKTTYAGLWTIRTSFTNEDALAIMLRGLISDGVENVRMEMFTMLINVIRRSFDTREITLEGEPLDDSKPKAKGGRKRVANPAVVGRMTKQRKTAKVQTPSKLDDRGDYQRISSARANVAREALVALRYALVYHGGRNSEFVATIRNEMTLSQVQSILQLGDLLHKVMIQTRVDNPQSVTLDPPPPGLTSQTVILGNSSRRSNEFSALEKTLWSAHMTMCQVLARGTEEYEGEANTLFTEMDRKVIFESIAGSKTSLWPLNLPNAHQAFLIANLTCMPPSSEQSSPEQFLVKQFVKAIKERLQNLHDIEETAEPCAGSFVAEARTLLSYHDAVVVILAYSRLPVEAQRKSLGDLIGAIPPALQKLEPDSLASNRAASTFLARTIVLVCAMMSIQTYGHPLRQVVFTAFGSLSSSLPEGNSSPEGQLSRRYFMGLLGDWESPGLPVFDRTTPVASMKDGFLRQIQSLLESAFRMGFQIAHKDQGYLLFASWNGLGKLYSEAGADKFKSSDSIALEISDNDYPRRILQMRDDVCMIQTEVQRIAAGQRTMTSMRFRSHLKSTLQRANLLISRLVDAVGKNDLDASLLALFSSLPTYVASSIAAHTKPGNDYFSNALTGGGQRRNRGYSSESERINSDIDSSVDTEALDHDAPVADAVARLRDCCDAFGAAPTHPDWLDVSCSFHEGIRSSDAVVNAVTALRLLNKIARTAFVQYQKNILECLNAYKADKTRATDEEMELCFDLLSLTLHEEFGDSPLGPGAYFDDRDWKEDVSTLCDLPPGLLDLIMDDSQVKNPLYGRGSLAQNSGHRLCGHLQGRKRPFSGWEYSMPELRAGGEWDILLAESLAIACLEVKRYSDKFPDTNADSDTLEPDVRMPDASCSTLTERMLASGQDYLKAARMWHVVMSAAINGMLPASSLLRMGLNKVGRSPHPFSFGDNSDDPWDAVPVRFTEELVGNTYSSDLVAATACEVLATISSVSAHTDDSITASCQAVAAQLVVDTTSFDEIESLQTIRLALNGLRGVVDHSGQILERPASVEVLPFIIERLLLTVEDYGRKGTKAGDEYGILQTMFRLSQHSIRTILPAPTDVFLILKSDEVNTTAWIRMQDMDKAIGHLVAVTCGEPIKATDRSRAAATLLLEKLLSSEWYHKPERQGSLLKLVSRTFDALPKSRIKDALLCDLCGLGRTKSVFPFHGYLFSRLLLFLIGGEQKFKHTRYIHDTLVGSLAGLSILSISAESAEYAMQVLLTLGCQFNTLTLIGSQLLGFDRPEQKETVGCGLHLVAIFFDFVKKLNENLAAKRSFLLPSDKSQGTDTPFNHPRTSSPTTLSRRCSFVEKTGYHGQHWYNCYTCGLVWEKGCCTLCALVCHKGHDVSYSRYSSFFCDCAAEDGSANSQSRISCQCMVPIAAGTLEQLRSDQMADINMELEKPERMEKHDPAKPKYSSLGIEIAVARFSEHTQQALKDLPKSLDSKVWFDALIKLLRVESEKWKVSKKSMPVLQALEDLQEAPGSAAKHRTALGVLRSLLGERREKPLEVVCLQGPALMPIRVAKGFHTKMSADASSNAQLLARLNRSDLSRSSLVADSRGRLIVAEPGSLVFCSTIPAIASRYTSGAAEQSLSREQMCILGMAAVSFNIVGMDLCSENERHLVVWGFAESSVVVITQHWDGIEKKLDLSLDMECDDGDPDHLVKCEFVPGSQTSIVVGYGHFIKIYDMTKCGDDRVTAIVAFNLGFDASLKDISFVPLAERPWPPARPQDMASRMFMLLENGRLHSISIKINVEGRVESPNGQLSELSEPVSLPRSGVIPQSGSTFSGAGMTSKSFGEGSNIVYLKQSRLLLYTCASSGVLALLLNSTGNVESTFELLPHILTTEVLSRDEDGHSIVGPYSHWTELGPCYGDDGTFFRVACVGRSSKTNQPKLICIHFNNKEVRVKEISCALSSTFGLSLSFSFEGICSFSMPFVGDNVRERRAFGERSFLCASTSSGSILFFGEEKIDVVNATSGELELISLEHHATHQVQQPKFPLTIFEHLQNVSECEELYFCGEGTGCNSAELKSKLLRDRSPSFVCHRREGCTLSISLRPPTKQMTKIIVPVVDSENLSVATTHAIVAVRVLVGSSPGNVPSRVVVQGRPVELSPRVKKWYSLPLTNEEVAIGVRSGFVTLGIGPPSDPTSNSGIDAVEVYVKDRKELRPWLEKYYYKDFPMNESDLGQSSNVTAVVRDVDDPSSQGFRLGAKALACFCELSPESVKNMDEDQRRCVQSIVEETACTPDTQVTQVISDFLRHLEPNDRLRGSLFDESILRGWMRALIDLKTNLPESPWAGPEGRTRWTAVRRFLLRCLAAVSKIARDRPMVYLRCMDALEITSSTGSIALQVLRYVCDACRMGLPCIEMIDGASGIVSLCLTEAAIRLNTERGRHLAGLNDVCTLLDVCTPDLAQSACDALSGFCCRAGNSEEDEANLFRMLQGARLVAYQCDSCGLCPMKDVRYSCLEEAFDIDLCHVCFTRAKEYAQANSFDAAIEIVLDDRVIGTETKLTCADVERMEAVPLEKMDVAQLEPFSDSAMIADEELQTALRLSLGEPRSEGNEPISQTEAQAYDDFVSFVFSGMVSLVSSHLMKGGRNQRLAPVLRVCLDLIRNSANSGTTCDRARQFAKEMKMGISHLLLDGRSAGGIVSNDSLWSIISCLRAAQFLLVPNEADPASIIENLQGEEDSKARENPEVLCDMHQIPAVRRRSAKGKNKDRRFYVCGRERGQRCTFFRWADELEGRQVTKLKISPLLKKVVLENLWGENVKESVPLHIALCRFLEAEIFEHRDAVEVPVERLGQRLEKTTAGGRLASLYDDASFLRDVADGVICSREKLQDVCRGHAQADDPSHNNAFQLDLFGTRDPKKHLLEAALVLVALVADYKTPGITRWFSLLCEIENSSNFKESRGLACKVLKLLCGKERALFHSVRDHFSFGFQFRALFRTAAPLLETAILVSERARVCGAHWTASAKLEWDSLSYGGLIGCDYLISDNDYPEPRLRSIGKILDDLIAVVRNGTESWRRFCGHTTLPPFHRDPKRTSPDHAFAEKMARLPPIVVLFWAACSLSGVNQVKAFRLIGMALTRTQGGLNFDIGEMSDGQTDTAIMVAISGAASSAPESLLLSTAKQLSVEDMSVFVLHFVLAGASSELRRACHLFALKIAVDIPRRERTALFTKLLSSKFLGIGEYGRSSTEFLNFLQGLAPDLDPLSSLEEYGDLILDSFIDQMEALKYDGSNEKWAIIENCHRHVPVLKKKLHLTDCLHCFRTKHTSGNKGDKDDPCTTGPSKRVAITRAASRQAKKWRPEQVSVFSRQRVDSIRAGSSSNEFNTYYLLRHRVVIGDIYLTVSDPRGRFVKGVTIYYSPHPAKDASVLKSDEYAPKWQKCATMVLPRGASRASANLAYSVVAANLRIEYTDFYERPGGSKASDGSPLVHCPRCTRVVTNAHGVCGNCGEVAFQCRKCRHINYDRLDAFLCVECGYCASGAFALEINAAVASNAIAIVSDKELTRAMKILGAVNALYDAVKSALIEKIKEIDKQSQEPEIALASDGTFDAHLDSALLGLPPAIEGSKANKTTLVAFLDRLDKPGSLVRMSARPESLQEAGRSANAAGNRTQSLLRLARQIRSESGVAWDRRRSGDLLIRHLGRGIAVDTLEGQRNLIGLLEDGSVLESADSLGRAIAAGARASARGDRLTVLGSPGRPSEGLSGNTSPPEHLTRRGKKLSAKETLEECQRLHSLMREAQHERHELKRRIQAWEMMNEGRLVDTGRPIVEDDEIDTCQCSVCGPAVAFNLLTLWAQLFAARPELVRVDVDFINFLLTDSVHVGKALSDRMLDTVTEIAAKSEEGARLVLSQIRRRLLATNDPVSAEILGKVMTIDGHFMADEFAELAIDRLSLYK